MNKYKNYKRLEFEKFCMAKNHPKGKGTENGKEQAP